jgi:hypothetical protein
MMNLKRTFSGLFVITTYRILTIIMMGLGLLVAFGGAVMILTYHNDPILWLGVILFEFLLPVPFIILLILLSRRYLRDIEGMMDGKAWAHWRYNAQEWQSFNKVESRRDRREVLKEAPYTFMSGGAMLVIGLMVGLKDFTANLFVWLGVLIIGAGVVRVVLSLRAGATAGSGWNSQSEVYISPLGIYRVPCGYKPLFGVGQSLCQVKLNPGEPTTITFDCMIRRDSTSTGYNMKVADLVIPAGCEDEAKNLVERFNNEILKIAG